MTSLEFLQGRVLLTYTDPDRDFYGRHVGPPSLPVRATLCSG